MAAAGVASDQEPGCGNTNLSDKAYREIEEKMVMLVLRPGDIISENVLAKTLGIGRTPIREALQRLEREGLVSILPINSYHFLHGIGQASAGMTAYSVMWDAAAMTARPVQVR